MISVNNREAFLDLIRPPLNYKFTYCIGTTFTLELPCLIQLALNSLGKNEEVEKLSVYDGYNVINDFSKKACIFTQNCRIKALPAEVANAGQSKKGSFFSLLDGMVEEVPTLSAKSAFHPKVWFIRYDSENGEDEPVFKFFVMSRNLTSSLKWDISSCVVGTVGKKSKINDEIKEFFKMLHAKSSLKGVGKKKDLINKALKDLDTVEFELPQKNKDFEFSFKWGSEKKWEPIVYTNYKKIIVVSPFLSQSQVKELSKHQNCILITSKKDLKYLVGFEDLQKKTFVMASHDMDLHAKMYFGLHEAGTDVFIGSANCTGSAWYGENVEANIKFLSNQNTYNQFCTEFIYADKNKLHNWLVSFESVFTPELDKEGEEKEHVENILDEAQGLLSMGEFHIKYEKESCQLTYQGDLKPLPIGVSGVVRILGVHGEAELKLVLEDGFTFHETRKNEISSFISIELKYKNFKREFCTVAISNLNREHRNNSILSQTIKDWDCFWEYLGVILNFDNKHSDEKEKGKKGNPRTPETSSSKGNVQWRYLEPLLLSGINEPDIIDKVEIAMKVLEGNEKNGVSSAEFKKFKNFWLKFKEAMMEIKHHG